MERRALETERHRRNFAVSCRASSYREVLE